MQSSKCEVVRLHDCGGSKACGNVRVLIAAVHIDFKGGKIS
jgi:hypothetical protein